MSDQPSDIFHDVIVESFRAPRQNRLGRRTTLLLRICYVLFVFGMIMSIAAVVVACQSSPQVVTGTPVPAPRVSRIATTATDQQFVDQLNAIMTRYPNSKPVTVGQVPLFTSVACQPGNPYEAIEPAAEWQQVSALLVKSGRCAGK